MFNQKDELTNQVGRGWDLGSCEIYRCAEGSREQGLGVGEHEGMVRGHGDLNSGVR